MKPTSHPDSRDDSSQKDPVPQLPAAIPPGSSMQEMVADDDPWEPQTPPGFIKRWTSGWRLIGLIAVLTIAYGSWRGGQDYQSLKSWRARTLATKAAAAAASGQSQEAAALLDQAAILAPLEPQVMRTMADFCEPRQDIMAIYALRQIVRSGAATSADLERLCRLAIDWGHPEMAATDTLKEWAAAPPGNLTALQLRLSALWFASRGQYTEGENRLRQALNLAEGTPESPVLEVALSRLQMNAASSSGMAESAAAEPLRRLSSVAYSPSTPLTLRAEATRLLAGLLLHPSRRELLTPVRVDLLRTAFTDLAAESAKTDPATATGYQLAAVTVDLAASPDRRDVIMKDVVAQANKTPPAPRLTIARWLNENAAPQDALTLCNLPPLTDAPDATQPADWFTVRLDAHYALREFDPAIALLSTPSQPLPAHQQELYLYRLGRAAGHDETRLAARRTSLEKAAARAQPKDALAVAENLERSGYTASALTLFTSLKGHPHAGLTARLGMVRCLDTMPDQSGELIQALESVLQLWPQSDQARNDLAYLRLLDGKPLAADLETAASLHATSPWFLSYRITAALALLHQKKPAEALTLLQAEPIPWDRVRPGWQAIYAATLTANGKHTEAKPTYTRLKATPLRPGERALLGTPRL